MAEQRRGPQPGQGVGQHRQQRRPPGGVADRGLDRDTGRQRWSVEAPGGAQDGACAATTPNSRRVGVVMLEVDGECTHAVAVDAHSGRQLWSKQLLRDDIASHVHVESGLAVGERTLGVAAQCGTVYRFSLADSASRRPLTKPDETCESQAGPSGNQALAYREEGERPTLTLYNVQPGLRPPPLAALPAARARVGAAHPRAQATDRRPVDRHTAQPRGPPGGAAPQLRRQGQGPAPLHRANTRPYGEWPLGLALWRPPISSGRYLAYPATTRNEPPAKVPVQGLDLLSDRKRTLPQDSTPPTVSTLAGLAGSNRLVVLQGPADQKKDRGSAATDTLTVLGVDMGSGQAKRLGTVPLGDEPFLLTPRPAGVDAHHPYLSWPGDSGGQNLVAYRLP